MPSSDRQSDDLVKIVTQALKLYRESRFLDMSMLPIAQTDLVLDCLAPFGEVSPDIRGSAVGSILKWGIERMRPSGEKNWMNYRWRAYNTLNAFYIEGERMQELADLMAVARQTLYDMRSDAIAQLANILNEEMQNPSDLQGRIHQIILDQYNRYQSKQKTLLSILAAFDEAMPVSLFFKIAQENGIDQPEESLLSLAGSPWLISNADKTEYLLQPVVSTVLQTALTPQQRKNWHRQIALYHFHQKDGARAVYHYFAAGFKEHAARVLIDSEADMQNEMRAEELIDLIQQFDAQDVEEDSWSKLKIAEGNAMQTVGRAEESLVAYQLALNAPDPKTKALAYFSRANVLHRSHLQEALAHFAYSIRILEANPVDDQLLARIYIRRAGLMIEDTMEMDVGRSDLEKAAALVSPEDREFWSDIQNAWMIYYFRQQNQEKAVEHGYEGWLAAIECNSIERIMRLGHNLGIFFAQTGKFKEAFYYLEKCREVAEKAGNLEMIANTEKSIGGCYFMQGAFPEAIEHYQRALDTFRDAGNENLIAHVLYDLAEAYGANQQFDEMKVQFERGSQMAKELNDQRVQDEFAQLGQNYYLLHPDLSPRQRQGLQWLRSNQRMSNSDYRERTGVSARQAVRDLTELEEANLIVKIGQGRGTTYQLASGLSDLSNSDLSSEEEQP